MRFRTTSALLAGKAAGLGIHLFRAGGGTTLPGRLARKLDPDFVSEMVRNLPLGCVLITGTNGKTTTSSLLASALDQAGMTPLHNRTGANLMAGVASALVGEVSLAGKTGGRLGLFEVDEAALPAAVEQTRPKLVMVNNLFRDQLDRYGELDTLAKKMGGALRGLHSDSVVVLNADDPLVASIGDGLEARVVFFGVEDRSLSTGVMQHAADSKHCPSCGAALSYEFHLFGHLGGYKCPSCGVGRPVPTVAALSVKAEGMKGSRCQVRYPGGTTEMFMPLPGLYNVYNMLAATAAALSLGVDIEVIKDAVLSFDAAFGRVERIKASGREVLMVLAKNPAGLNEVIRTLSSLHGRIDLVLALNDNIADGRDVSWIWDVDFEMFAGRLRNVVCSGIRAHDMALRVKYAGIGEETRRVEPDLGRALDMGLSSVEREGTLYVVPTYTAMLELRSIMSKRGLVKQYWEG